MHLDKAPDAFRTISEVADELDIPQHVLRFWETRFTQIKPMKRSGGRRYYRPDDVDLLRGIRRLLYGEGYTIRGVQRILKEHGIKSVQRLSEAGLSAGGLTAAAFGPPERAAPRAADDEQDDTLPDDEADRDDSDADDDAADDDDAAENQIDAPPLMVRREPVLSSPSARIEPAPRAPFERAARPPAANVTPEIDDERRGFDRERLEAVLSELVACRQLLDSALKE
jgi:DNA-binding transcriptional MerR regulator